MPIAILAALREEIDSLLRSLQPFPVGRVVVHGREYFHGLLHGREVVLGLSRCGKVAAAVTATQVIERFRPSELWFTGVAGALWPSLKVGDVVVARGLIQHDMDARPLFPRFEVPFTGQSRFLTDPRLTLTLQRAAEEFLATGLPAAIAGLELDSPRVVLGDIATGDRFVAGAQAARELAGLVPECACVEMEGAAVAQVCTDAGVPFGVLRVISDRADDDAGAGFAAFIQQAASLYTAGIIALALQRSGGGEAPLAPGC